VAGKGLLDDVVGVVGDEEDDVAARGGYLLHGIAVELQPHDAVGRGGEAHGQQVRLGGSEGGVGGERHAAVPVAGTAVRRPATVKTVVETGIGPVGATDEDS